MRRVGDGLADMRRGVELLREQKRLSSTGSLKIALAEAEARAGDLDRALAILDEALATSDRTGHRTFDAELHRVRGEMLLKRDPANPAPAEEALPDRHRRREAARHAQLRTARRALARQALSIDRPPRRAHAVLAPALDGFAPTPEMPEIAEAQALLAALEEMDEVKAEVARRRRENAAARGLRQRDDRRRTATARAKRRQLSTRARRLQRRPSDGSLSALRPSTACGPGAYVRGELAADARAVRGHVK